MTNTQPMHTPALVQIDDVGLLTWAIERALAELEINGTIVFPRNKYTLHDSQNDVGSQIHLNPLPGTGGKAFRIVLTVEA